MEAAGFALAVVGRIAQQSHPARAAIFTLNIFLDSSALAKRYVHEPGSRRVEELLASASELGVSVLCLSEVISALCRLRREHKLTNGQYRDAKEALLVDIADASVINLTEDIIARAVNLLERWPLRSSDSLHIASASEWSAELFVSADARQCAVARAYGLPVERLPL